MLPGQLDTVTDTTDMRMLFIWVVLSVGMTAWLPAWMTAAEPTLQRVQVSQFHMGMMVDLIVYSSAPADGQAACGEAFTRVAALNRILSDYEPESELNQLCAHAGKGPLMISADLYQVLAIAQRVAEASHGHFDVTAAPVIGLWRRARTTHRIPDAAELSAAQALVGYSRLRLDPLLRTAELTQPGMRLDLGAIAKGYVGDQALAMLRNRGFSRAAFIAGGDMVFGDAPPASPGWPVRPAKPGLPDLHLRNCACSVSGDTEQFVEIGGVRYSHVLDAITGQPLSERRMCMIIAPLGQAADPLSTLGTLLPESDFTTVTASMPEVQSWVFTIK
jgi:FAD:protein FMN transferase